MAKEFVRNHAIISRCVGEAVKIITIFKPNNSDSTKRKYIISAWSLSRSNSSSSLSELYRGAHKHTLTAIYVEPKFLPARCLTFSFSESHITHRLARATQLNNRDGN